MSLKKLFLCGVPVFMALTLNACIGASMDISIRADGSGKIALEYRVPQMMESLGKLDGNERWPLIPVGRADFERGLARIPGLSLSSFSVKENVPGGALGGRDYVVRAVVEFRNTDALLAFLDSTGSRAFLVREADPAKAANLLRLTLLDPSAETADADLLSLLREVSGEYRIDISLTAPSAASLTVIPASVTSARTVTGGKKVSFSIATGELLSLSGGLALEIAW